MTREVSIRAATELKEFLKTRADYLRIVAVQCDQGAWGIALVIDGFYPSKVNALAMADYYTDFLEDVLNK